MKKVIVALVALSLSAALNASPGTGTFEEGGLRWYRDHSPAEIRRLHLDKNIENDKSPNIWMKSEGHCAARIKIEAPAFYPGWPEEQVENFLDWLWRHLDGRGYYLDTWSDLLYYKMDRYEANGKDEGLKTKVRVNQYPGIFPLDWVTHRISSYANDHSLTQHNEDPSDGLARWNTMVEQFEKAMADEEYVHYAYFEGIQSFDLDTFHSATISRTDTWGQDGRWTHKLRIKSCGGYWEETRYVDTVSWRVTDFDNALHRGIDDQFNRRDACRNKGGWETTYLVKHSDDRIMVTHRCKGKRSDGHFARGEYKLSGWQSRWLAKLLNLSVDHY